MTNYELIEKFYSSFSKADIAGMLACYDNNVFFEDPAFGPLKGEAAKNMWRMLIKRSKGNIKVSYSNIKAEGDKGSADWEAYYIFAETGRPVINRIHAEFEFKDGKITRHTDHFDLWKWAGQALGLKGYLLGWTPFIKNAIRKKTTNLLREFTAKNKPD